MSHQPPSRRSDLILIAVALGIGAVIAAAYATFRFATLEHATTADRWAEFGDAMLFPGALIIAAVAAMVWLGWKANID